LGQLVLAALPLDLDDLDLAAVLEAALAGHDHLLVLLQALADLHLAAGFGAEPDGRAMGGPVLHGVHVGLAVFIEYGALRDQQGVRAAGGFDPYHDERPGPEALLRLTLFHGHLDRAGGLVYHRADPGHRS
jgi:hypothetical protein